MSIEAGGEPPETITVDDYAFILTIDESNDVSVYSDVPPEQVPAKLHSLALDLENKLRRMSN